MPGFKPRGTGYEPFMMQLSAQDSLTFIRLGNPTWDFLGGFVGSRNFFFFGLVFATIHLMSDPETKSSETSGLEGKQK